MMLRVWLMILVAVGLLVAINVAWVNWRYALDDRPLRVDVPTADGWTVVAWHRPAVERRFTVPVILCHGLANNHAFMEFRGEQNLAKFLSVAGFECYSVDLRGAGASQAPDDGQWDATIDDHIQFDVPALVKAVCERAGTTQVAWVGHSLGGTIALAAATASVKDKLAAIVTVGSPLFFRYRASVQWLVRLAGWMSLWGRFDSGAMRLIAPFAGRTPAPALTKATANFLNLESRTQRFLAANVFAPIWKGVLKQLEDWVLNDACRSVDKQVDYRAGLAALTMPILLIGGSVDMLAPPELTQTTFEMLPATGRQVQLFGKAYGHPEEYGHGDLVVGIRAHDEVYPVIKGFLESHLACTADLNESQTDLKPSE